MLRSDELAIILTPIALVVAIVAWSLFTDPFMLLLYSTLVAILLFPLGCTAWHNWLLLVEFRREQNPYEGSISDDCVVLPPFGGMFVTKKWLQDACGIETSSKPREGNVQWHPGGHRASLRWTYFVGAVVTDDMLLMVHPVEIARELAADESDEAKSFKAFLESACIGEAIYKDWFKSESQWQEALAIVDEKLGLRRNTAANKKRGLGLLDRLSRLWRRR